MNSSPMQTGVQCLRRLAAAAGRLDESDEQLLNAFTIRRDDSAFAALVRRHGPMVFHVCRRVLEHQQDAEDAFQATFLVLVRNPASLRSKSSLSSFLHGTAYRTAMKVKRSAARRGKWEGSLGALTQPRSPINPAEDLSWREVRTFLDEEIARLPEKYRTAFVLCCLENLSQAEAARRLGLKERTLSSQLAAARKRLQQALTRRGVELTAILAAIALLTQPASALPAGLAAKTIKAVVAMGSGKELAAVVSTSVAEMVEGATTALMASKVKIAAVLLLVATSGSLVGLYRRASEPLAATIEDKNATSPQQTAAKTLEIKGRVFGADGQPKAGAKLLLLRADGNLKQLGTTAADGGFTVAVPKAATNHYLIAQADGLGLDFLPLPAGKSKMPIVLRLVKDRAIRGRIVNTEGKPVAGVRLAVKTIGVYADNSLDTFLSAWKMRPLWARLPDGDKRIGSGMERLFATTTDDEGHFAFHGVGDERLVSLRLSGGGMADDELCIVNRDKFDPQPFNRAMRDNARNTPPAMQHRVNRQPLYGPELSVIAQAEKILRGVVKDASTGKERSGVLVHLTARDEDVLLHLPYSTRTDAHGRYELRGVRKAARYKLVVASDTQSGHMACDTWVADTPGYQPVRADIAVKKGVIITGRVIDQATGKAISGSAMTDVLVNNPFLKDYPPFYYTSWEKTDAHGRFRVVTIPGPVLLLGMADYQQTVDGMNAAMKYKKAVADAKYPQYFEKSGSETLYFRSVNLRGLVQGNYCKVLDIKPGSDVVEQDIVLDQAQALTVAVRDAEGRPVRGVWAAGISPANGMGAIQFQGDSCSVFGVEKGKPRLMVFYDAKTKRAGLVTLKGDEQQPVSVKLGPMGAIKGRLLDGDGKPLAGVVVEIHYRDREAEEMNLAIHKEQVRGDAAGAFAVDKLIPGKPFAVVFLHRGQPLAEERANARPPVFLEVKPGECRDLKDLRMKPLAE